MNTFSAYGKGKYKKAWHLFFKFHGNSFQKKPPEEEDLLVFFRNLLEEEGNTICYLWGFYCQLEAEIWNKFSIKLNSFTGLTRFLKKFDKVYKSDKVDKVGSKMCFDTSDIQKFVETAVETQYWEIRKVIVILTHFGKLSQDELNLLELENMVQKEDGLHVSHFQGKQKTNENRQSFVVPKNGPFDFAAVVQKYLSCIQETLGHLTGHVFFKPTRYYYSDYPMPISAILRLPREVAKVLNKDNPALYNFNSLRGLPMEKR